MENHQIPIRQDSKSNGKALDSLVKHQILLEKGLKPYGKPSDSYGKMLEIFM